MTSRTVTALVVALALVVLTAGLTFAQVSAETAQACIGVSGRLRLYEGGTCPNGSTPAQVSLGAGYDPGYVIVEQVLAGVTSPGGHFSGEVYCPAGKAVTGSGFRNVNDPQQGDGITASAPFGPTGRPDAWQFAWRAASGESGEPRSYYVYVICINAE